jgi:hypothetical protein
MVEDFLTEHFLLILTLFLFFEYVQRDLDGRNEILG